MHLARRCIMMISILMYIGQSLKDVIRQPRPNSPPVIRLEAAYETEYGMPSTHTALAVTVPLSFLLFLSYTQEISVGYIAFACAWSLSIMCSRIYLGMHTPLQILFGMAIPAVIVPTITPCVVWFDELQLASSETFSSVMTAVMFMLAGGVFYIDTSVDPNTQQAKWTTSPGDTAEIVGWCAGFLTGTRWSHHINAAAAAGEYTSVLDDHFSSSPYFHLVFRFVCGALVLGPATLIARKIICHFFIVANGVTDKKIFQAKKIPTVEWPYKFVATFASAVTATYFIPELLRSYGLW